MSHILLYPRNLLWLVALVCCMSTGFVSGQSQPTQRYVGLMLLNLSDHGRHERNLIQMAHSYGLNSVYLTIQWDKVYYDSPDKADWARFDDQIKLATDLGMSVAIRIYLGRAKGRLNGFWDWEKDGLKDHEGISQMGGFTTTTFRYSHEPTAAKAAAFVKEVVQRYKWVHDQGKLIFIATANTPEQESGFPGTNFEPDTNHPKIYWTMFDYSRETIEEYREWLKLHYKKIERLNFAWGSGYSSFEEVYPSLVPWEPKESFKRRYGKDWYLFRHGQLKKYIETLSAAVKSVSPTIRYVSDYGAVTDEISGLRGTIAFHNLDEKSDGVKVNDDLYWDHRFTTDILRSNLPRGAFIGNEVFITDNTEIPQIERHVNECFEHGADLVAFVVSLESAMERHQAPMRAAAARWKSSPKHEIVAEDTVSFSLLRAIEGKGILDVIYAGWRMYAHKNPGSPKPVDVRIRDDMFVPSYWELATNRNPHLKVPLPMQIKALGRPFSFEISKEHFADVDGWIEKIEMPDLPGWLSFDGRTVSGTGNALGDTRLEVKAIDDEGGAFSAYLTLRIDPTENTNIPPRLQLNFSELVARVNEPYSFELPAEMFMDEDGHITKVEASGLPGWLSFANRQFTGRPVTAGDYLVVLKAYDDEDAFVESYLTIRVMDQDFFNTAPFIANPIPIQYAPENEVYSYEIPSDIFADGDGYITNVVLHGHPTWLSMTFNRVEGLPPGKGEYRFFVRAFDNNGSFVDAPVTLRVEEAALRFTLQAGGDVINPDVIGLIERGKVYQLDSIPALLNISVEGNYDFDRIRMRMTGPFVHRSQTRRHPYTLYFGADGFEPVVGRYDLFGEAYTWDDSLLYVTSTHFYISAGAAFPSDITGDMPEWTTYPVPFHDVLNLKTGNEDAGAYQFTVVTTTGQMLEVPEKFITKTGLLHQINFTNLGLPAGVYFVQARQDGVLRKQIRVAKY